MKKFIFTIIFLIIGGCVAPNKDYQRLSSGYIGCDPNEIEISNLEFGSGVASWKAVCKNKEFVCSARGVGADSCKERH